MLFVLALVMPVPYVVLSPGPTYNTLGKDDQGNTIIVIKGRTTKTTRGHLNLTTVSVTTDKITAFQAFTGWLEHDEVVVPRAAVYPPGQSQQQTDEQNTQDFISSQDSANSAALCELRYPQGFGVISVLSNGPSRGVLQPGDKLLQVDGKPASSATTLSAVLTGSRREPGCRWSCSARAPSSPSPSRSASRRRARRAHGSASRSRPRASRRSPSTSGWPTRSAARRPG